MTISVQAQQIAELQPKASYYDLVLNCADLISTTVIAKDYGQSATWLNELLKQKGIQYNNGEIWLLYQKYAQMGLTSTKTHTYYDYKGQPHTKIHTYWTQKGRLFIYELLKREEILPIIEKLQDVDI
ncbi:MAG: phage antirepressor KilAC domain-containing protein [Oscillospiraceae bacterium]|nr:phage antirepressor KilAC domain-containing protein [Oscillospiraceae bacterium]